MNKSGDDQGHRAEIERIRHVYLGSYKTEAGNRGYIWHPRNPVSIYYRQTLEKALVAVFNELDLEFDAMRVLDLGCGVGNFLNFLVSLHCQPENMFGIDLMPYRIERAAYNSPSAISYLVGEGGSLPYRDGGFDLVSQFTVFSSILDGELRRQVASEMLRVISPKGIVLWYDMQSGQHQTTRGITRQEILDLFPGCEVLIVRNLHARYVSRLARRSQFLSEIWDRVPGIKKTHLLAILRFAPATI